MKRVFVDTNIFIRYLVADVPTQINKVDNLFNLAEEGKLELVTGPPVFFEIAWTLKSFYNMQREQIYECLTGILGLRGLKITDIDILEEALELYNQTHSDFGDAYIAVLSKKIGADSIATFNAKHFKNLDVFTFPLE